MTPDRMSQRAAFASKIGSDQLQQAKAQYGEWAKNNPQAAAPRQMQAPSAPTNSPSMPPPVYGPGSPAGLGNDVVYMGQYGNSSPAGPAASGGSNTAYTRAWNAYAPPVNTTQQTATTDPLRGIPRNTTSTYRTTAARSFGGEGDGNLAYMPDDRRPAAFSAEYYDLDGQQADSPSVNYRDALIDRINNAASQYYANSGVSEKNLGPQQFDMPALMREARDMAKGGYVNPLLQGLYQQ